MPQGDRTGPSGMGPKTGKGAGFCNGNQVPSAMNNRSERGFGRGGGCRGSGGGRRGFRHWWRATGIPGFLRVGPAELENGEISSENDEKRLKEQENILSQQLQMIQKRIEELGKGKGS